MTQAQYRVVFHGEVDAARDIDEVKRNLGMLFKTTDDQIDRLFAKRRAVIKNDVDYQVAMTYKSALRKAGAVCHVESLAEREPIDALSDVQPPPTAQADHDASSVLPFLSLLPSAFSYPLRGLGQYIYAGGVLWSLLTGYFGLLLGMLTGGYLGAYMMKIISDSADGEEQLMEWLDLDFWGDEIIRPYAFMLGVVMISYLPALIYASDISFRSSPNYLLLGALLALGSLYAPMGLATTSVLKTLDALHPFFIVRSALKIPRDYAIVSGFLFVAVCLTCVNPGAWLPVPWSGMVLGKLLGVYLLMVSMRMLGLLCQRHEARLGWFSF